MNIREAGGDLALIQTSVLFSFKCEVVSIIMIDLKNKSREMFPNKVTCNFGQVIEQTIKIVYLFDKRNEIKREEKREC